MNDKLIQFYTDLIFVCDRPEKVDVIFVPGSEEAMLGEYAAKLYHEGMAKVILVSGKYSITRKDFQTSPEYMHMYPGEYDTEADFLGKVMERNGVPTGQIWKEKTATYTYENALASHKLIQHKGLKIKSAIICCKPSHARRCLLYYQLVFPDTKFLVCPCKHNITKDNWYQTEDGIENVLGEVQRLGTQFFRIIKERCLET